MTEPGVMVEKITKPVGKIFRKYPLVAWGGLAMAVGGGLYVLSRKPESSVSALPAYPIEDIPVGEGPGSGGDADLLNRLEELMGQQQDYLDYNRDTNAALLEDFASSYTDYMQQILSSISSSRSLDPYTYEPPAQIPSLIQETLEVADQGYIQLGVDGPGDTGQTTYIAPDDVTVKLGNGQILTVHRDMYNQMVSNAQAGGYSPPQVISGGGGGSSKTSGTSSKPSGTSSKPSGGGSVDLSTAKSTGETLGGNSNIVRVVDSSGNSGWAFKSAIGG